MPTASGERVIRSSFCPGVKKLTIKAEELSSVKTIMNSSWIHKSRDNRRDQQSHLDDRVSQVVIRRKTCQTNESKFVTLRIGKWNVTYFYFILSEINNMKLYIMIVCHIEGPGCDKCDTSNITMYYSENNNSKHRRGVGIIFDRAAKN